MGLPIIPEMMYISVNVKLESTFCLVEFVNCQWSLRYIIGDEHQTRLGFDASFATRPACSHCSSPCLILKGSASKEAHTRRANVEHRTVGTR